MSQTLGQFLDACASRAPEREAISYAPRDKVTERLTWRELRERSRRAAKRLVAAGAGKGTRVGFLCSNRTEWLPIAFGALRIGAILVPFSTLWKRDEIAYGLRHGDVQVLLALPRFLKHDYVERLFEIVPELANAPLATLLSSSAPALRRVVLLDRPNDALERWDDLAADVDDAVLDALEQAVFPTDLATIFFTSGTTAQAKAVLHCHGALTTAAVGVGERLGIGPDDAWWGHMPLFWSGGFVLGALATMAGGGRIVLQEAVDAGSALQLLEAERCTVMAGWHQAGPLLEHPDSPVRTLLTDATTRRAAMGVAMGLTAAALIYSPWGRRSGAHINPAVTLTFFRLGTISSRDALGYVTAQFVGGAAGIAAAAIPLRPWIAHPSVNYVATIPGANGSGTAFVAEAAISFVMMLVVLIASNHARWARFTGVLAALLIAGFITIEAPLSGMSMNPARTVASALFAGRWTAVWIYFVAPTAGMLLAAETYVRAGKRRAVHCAKLHHDDRVRCIFCRPLPQLT